MTRYVVDGGTEPLEDWSEIHGQMVCVVPEDDRSTADGAVFVPYDEDKVPGDRQRAVRWAEAICELLEPIDP